MNYKLEEFNLNFEYLQKFLQSNALLGFAVLLLTLRITTLLVSINFPQNIFFADITKAAIENLTNQTRQSLGLDPLLENQKLNEAAQLKAEDMVKNEYFSHTSPTGVVPWFWFSKAGYDYNYAGENLAIGFFESEEVFNAWFDSSSHRANLLNPSYKETGIAVLNGFGQNNTTIVVQLFGSQKLTVVTEKKDSLKDSSNVNNNSDIVNQPKVLSQHTELRLINDYDEALKDVVYGVSMVIIGILFTLILFNSSISFHKNFVFRSILLVVILFTAAFLKIETILLIIPHQIVI